MQNRRNNWEDRLCSMATDIDDETLANMLCDRVMKSKELRDQVNKWRKLDEDIPEEKAKKTYGALLEIIDDHIMYNQELRNRHALDRHTQHSHPAAPAPDNKGGGKQGKGGKGKGSKGGGQGKGKGDKGGSSKGKGGKGKEKGKAKGSGQGYCAFFALALGVQRACVSTKWRPTRSPRRGS